MKEKKQSDGLLENENEEARLVVTPCMIPLLRSASELAEVGLVGHKNVVAGVVGGEREQAHAA